MKMQCCSLFPFNWTHPSIYLPSWKCTGQTINQSYTFKIFFYSCDTSFGKFSNIKILLIMQQHNYARWSGKWIKHKCYSNSISLIIICFIIWSTGDLSKCTTTIMASITESGNKWHINRKVSKDVCEYSYLSSNRMKR